MGMPWQVGVFDDAFRGLDVALLERVRIPKAGCEGVVGWHS